MKFAEFESHITNSSDSFTNFVTVNQRIFELKRCTTNIYILEVNERTQFRGKFVDSLLQKFFETI